MGGVCVCVSYPQEDLPYSASAETMITLCNLTGLRHLEVPVSKAAANKFSSWGLQQLNRLTCLITHGHPFKLTPTDMAESPESSMDSSMGVCSSQASSWLSCMPELQVRCICMCVQPCRILTTHGNTLGCPTHRPYAAHIQD